MDEISIIQKSLSSIRVMKLNEIVRFIVHLTYLLLRIMTTKWTWMTF